MARYKEPTKAVRRVAREARTQRGEKQHRYHARYEPNFDELKQLEERSRRHTEWLRQDTGDVDAEVHYLTRDDVAHILNPQMLPSLTGDPHAVDSGMHSSNYISNAMDFWTDPIRKKVQEGGHIERPSFLRIKPKFTKPDEDK